MSASSMVGYSFTVISTVQGTQIVELTGLLSHDLPAIGPLFGAPCLTNPSPLAPFSLSSKRSWLKGGTLTDRRTAAKEAHRSVRRGFGGGRCGGNPPAQGRAEGPTAQLQWSVRRRFSSLVFTRGGQRGRRLRYSGTLLGLSLVFTRGVRDFTPSLDCTPGPTIS